MTTIQTTLKQDLGSLAADLVTAGNHEGAALVTAAAPADMPASDYVLMPRTLTAENGAKSALSGEFREQLKVDCPGCWGHDADIDCELCNGIGHWMQDIPVEWTTIKNIYRKAVECCAAPQQPVAASSEPKQAYACRIGDFNWKPLGHDEFHRAIWQMAIGLPVECVVRLSDGTGIQYFDRKPNELLDAEKTSAIFASFSDQPLQPMAAIDDLADEIRRVVFQLHEQKHNYKTNSMLGQAALHDAEMLITKLCGRLRSNPATNLPVPAQALTDEQIGMREVANALKIHAEQCRGSLDPNVLINMIDAAEIILVASQPSAPADVPQKNGDLIDWDRISEAAKQACNEYGQWMPERWLQLFVNAYNRKKS